MTPQSTLAISAVVLVVAGLGLGVRTLNRNHAWDLLTTHSREIVRHLVTVFLLVGTTAGTLFTFSNGRLKLAGIWETITSTGGIGLALESGVILAGWHIGQLDQRILTAKGKEAQEMRDQRDRVMNSFKVIICFSFIANFVFRLQDYGITNAPSNGAALVDILLAFFVALAPIALVYFFTIVLRPIPVDYEQTGKQIGARALALTVQGAGTVLLRLQAKMARGQQLSEGEMKEYGSALITIGMYSETKTQDQLHQIAATHGVQVSEDPRIIDASSTLYWSVSEVAERYHRTKRWAQLQFKQISGVRKGPGGEQEAPVGAIKRTLGEPETYAALPAPRRKQSSGEVPAKTNELLTNDNETETNGDELAAMFEEMNV